jgi:hypothetical protein
VNVLTTTGLVGISFRIVVAGRTFLLRLLAFYVLMDEEAATFVSYIIILNLVKIFKEHPDCRLEHVSEKYARLCFCCIYTLRTGLPKYEEIQARYDEPPRFRGQ